jgi:hypothetical protein
MTDIDLNVNPYWDDFDESKNYKKILALPGRVEEAREFTQIQTLIQSQITRLASAQYQNGQVLSGCLLTINTAKTQATISTGKIYAEGDVITFSTPTTITISGTGQEVLGIIKTEEIITEVDDPSLRDPAQGYDNYGQPGAHRLKVTWEWALLTTDGYGIFTLEDGVLSETTPTSDPKPQTVKEDVLDTIAQRNYEQFGNFVIKGFTTRLMYDQVNPIDNKQLIVSSGVARILGYDITLVSDYTTVVPVARVTQSVVDEPWTFIPHDSIAGTGGQIRLGNRPVASVTDVVATVLVVDGVGQRPSVTRGEVSGGADELSEDSVVQIIAVNQGGTWDPSTETFTGGTTFASNTYVRDGNNIDWSPSGAEPAPNTSYKVAYTYRRQMVKQIMAPLVATNEEITHGDSGGDDVIAHTWPCETNTMTNWTFYANDPVSGNPPDPEVEGFTTDYIQNTDFVILEDGTIDWYDHEVQILEITRGAGSTDTLSGFTDSFTMGYILDVAYYSNTDDMSFDTNTNLFITPTTEYVITDDYLSTLGDDTLDWSPGGSEPAESDHYFVAVMARKYKTLNHPIDSATWYANYYYWDTVVAGDYLARDSFYSDWVEVGSEDNVIQHYGLDLQNYINFWKSDNYQAASYNMDKPYPSTMVEVNYDYYLSRYILVNIDSDMNINLITGASTAHPTEPVPDNQDKMIILASIYCPADSLNMILTQKDVQTLTIADLYNIKNTGLQTQQNLANTMLDLEARSIPISNMQALTTTAFHDNSRIDPGWDGTTYAIDPDWEELALPHTDSFYSVSLDTGSSTCEMYSSICTLVPLSTTTTEQPYYTGHESIAPYALATQDYLASSQNTYMTITPSGDTVIIPETLTFATQADAVSWASSDIAKLSDPTLWFCKGWSGGTQKRTVLNEQDQYGTWYEEVVTASSSQTQTWTSTYMRSTQGNCRQLTITFSIPGGLVPTDQAELDFSLYFGGIQVTPTLTGSTPAGSAPGTFRPRVTDNGASGTFTIPANVPAGRIEVRATSTPMEISGNLWQQTVTAIYDSAIVEQVTMQYDNCRCNCWCYCNCNCWNCRGRCGTGPLAETLEPVGYMRVLKNIAVDFYAVSPLYGCYGCIIKTDNGIPTSNTVSTGMIGRQYLSASAMAGAGLKTFTFDDPIFLQDDCYAIVVTGEDGFNINSISEVAAGRDIRCKIATLGEQDITSGVVVGSQPFKNGILWRSLTGVTWEDDQTSDLKFKAEFFTYPSNVEHIAYMDSVSVTNATAFICNWSSSAPEGTSITFEYRTQTGSWIEFSPYRLTFLSEVATTIHFRARMKTTAAGVSPYVLKFAGLYVQSTGTSLLAVTDNFVVPSSDTVDVWLDSHMPTGATQQMSITFDNGSSFVTLNNPVDGSVSGNLIEYSAVDLNADTIKYRHHWKHQLTPGQVFTNVRVKITSSVSGPGARLLDPRFSRLIVIASNA